MPNVVAALRRTQRSLPSDDYSTWRQLRQAGLGLLDSRQPRAFSQRGSIAPTCIRRKTPETSDHPGLMRLPTLVYKPHCAFSFQAIPKIAIAHASAGATKNPGISLGRVANDKNGSVGCGGQHQCTRFGCGLCAKHDLD